MTIINAKASGQILPVVDETPIVYETGVPANTLTFDVTAYTAPRIVTWPNAALTVAGLEVAQTFALLQTFTTSPTSPGAGGGSERYGLGADTAAFIQATAIGNGASVGANNGTTIGFNAIAGGEGVAIGATATTGVNVRGVAIGYGASVTGNDAVAIGRSVTAGAQGLVIGSGASSTGTNSMAIGQGSSDGGHGDSVAVGPGATISGATANQSVLVGRSASITERSSVSVGYLAIGHRQSVAVGRSATTAGAQYGNAIGMTASATFNQSIAFGAFAATTKVNQLVIGSATAPINEFTFASGLFAYRATDTATTAAVVNVPIYRLNSSGTPAAGFGIGMAFQLESSTTENQDAARLAALWQTATHASRVADLVAYASDSAGEVEIWRGRAGAAPLFGVLGATPVVRQAHIADPAGGGTVDAEARTAINAILVVLENFGFVATA